jgi:hypothetical protein
MNMGAKQQLEQSMPVEDEQIREALNAHWHASAVGDANAERRGFRNHEEAHPQMLPAPLQLIKFQLHQSG